MEGRYKEYLIADEDEVKHREALHKEDEEKIKQNLKDHYKAQSTLTLLPIYLVVVFIFSLITVFILGYCFVYHITRPEMTNMQMLIWEFDHFGLIYFIDIILYIFGKIYFRK